MATQTGSPPHPESHHSGHDVAALTGPEVDSSPSNPQRLRQLYESMLKCSLVQERVEQLEMQGKVSFRTEQSFRSLATAVGALIELRAGDAVAAHDPLLTQLMRKAPLQYVFSALYGFESEYRVSHTALEHNGVHLVPAAGTQAAQFNVAAGVALASRLHHRHDIVLAHAPDGFTALGFWHEAATLASSERLPLVFVFETDSERASRLEDSVFRERAESYGMPGITVEGDDVVAVWRVAQESIHRARSGAGPTLIDCRVGSAQSGNGKAPSSRTQHALAHMQHYLQKRKFWEEDWNRELARSYSSEIDKSVAFAEKIRRAQ